GYFKYLLSRFNYDKRKFGLIKSIWRLIYLSLKHTPKPFASGHTSYNGKVQPVRFAPILHKFPATSGISFAANDFAKWISMLANQGVYNGIQIISKESLNRITSCNVPINNVKDDDQQFVKSRFERNKNMYYGSGFFSSVYSDNGKNGRVIKFHMGGTYGYVAYFAYSLDDDIAVAVNCNFGGTSHTLFAEYMANQFLDMCFGFTKIDWAKKELDNRKSFNTKKAYFEKEFIENNPMPNANLEEYTGVYTSDIYGDIKISIENNSLTLDNGINKAKLIHANGNTFTFSCMEICPNPFDRDEYTTFYKDASEKFNLVYISCFNEGNTIFHRK
ncbi:MAG: DUF3471 domain-containing protein, partial [Holosporales bacterium]|nr:DUF3471 domain-containing protein [Holosporales bacterium]